MIHITRWLVPAILFSTRIAGTPIAIPAPNGTYTVGLTILKLNNTDSMQPFTTQTQVPDLMLSVFYPTNETKTVRVPYMDRITAKFEDVHQAQLYGVNTQAGTFEKLFIQLAANGSSIAQSEGRGGWPVLLFGAAFGTSRLFYSALLSEVASTGYVVVAYDTPYDTDIVVYPDGRTIIANGTLTAAFNTLSDPAQLAFLLTADVNVRAQDASFIIKSLANETFAASAIPGCKACLNTTNVGYFGHSVGGDVGSTLMLNDTRVAGALNFDGAVSGDVVDRGLDRPYMLMAVTNQTREGQFARTYHTQWSALWANLRGSSFDLILNDAAHYTYSDYPLIFELLDIFPTNETILSNLAITTMNGTRAQHIVTTYTVAFFDWLLKEGSDSLLKSTTPEFPEISHDTGATEVFSNGTVLSATNGTVISNGGVSPSAEKSFGTPTFIMWTWAWALMVFLGASLLY